MNAGHRFTVFDNNAYKCVSVPRLERIIEREQKRGVTPLANIIVLQEMLAKVRHAAVGRMNRDAVAKLARHCGVPMPPSGRNVNFLSFIEGQVYRPITGAQHPLDRHVYDTWADIVRVVSQAGVDGSLDEITTDLDQIAKTLVGHEDEYIARVTGYARGPAETSPVRRNLNYAARIAARTTQLYKRQFTVDEIMNAILRIAQISSLAFALQDAIVTEMRRSGGGEKKYRDSVGTRRLSHPRRRIRQSVGAQ